MSAAFFKYNQIIEASVLSALFLRLSRGNSSFCRILDSGCRCSSRGCGLTSWCWCRNRSSGFDSGRRSSGFDSGCRSSGRNRCCNRSSGFDSRSRSSGMGRCCNWSSGFNSRSRGCSRCGCCFYCLGCVFGRCNARCRSRLCRLHSSLHRCCHNDRACQCRCK
jgi:hypothetical protein